MAERERRATVQSIVAENRELHREVASLVEAASHNTPAYNNSKRVDDPSLELSKRLHITENELARKL